MSKYDLGACSPLYFRLSNSDAFWRIKVIEAIEYLDGQVDTYIPNWVDGRDAVGFTHFE